MSEKKDYLKRIEQIKQKVLDPKKANKMIKLKKKELELHIQQEQL